MHVEKMNIDIFSTPVITVKKKSSRIQDINAAALALFGYKDASECLGKPAQMLLPDLAKVASLEGKELKTTLLHQTAIRLNGIVRISLFQENDHERLLVSMSAVMVRKGERNSSHEPYSETTIHKSRSARSEMGQKAKRSKTEPHLDEASVDFDLPVDPHTKGQTKAFFGCTTANPSSEPAGFLSFIEQEETGPETS